MRQKYLTIVKDFTKKYIFYITTIIVFTIFLIHAINFLDPDFGWHIRMGEIILKNGIPKTDPFSFSMPSYPFVDHEWLTNVIMATLYPAIGTIGLAFIFSILAISALLIMLRKDRNFWAIPSLILVTSTILPSLGIRPQVITWFFLSILFQFILYRPIWDKWKFILPILFILWTNLHGGFASGLAILLFYIVVNSLIQKRIYIQDLIIAVCCLLSTFINPYGMRIWWEVWMQLSDNSLRWNIIEWLPGIMRVDLTYLLLIALSVMFLIYYKTKFNLILIGLYICLLIAALTSQRHIALWSLIAIFVITSGLKMFYQQLKKDNWAQSRFFILYKYLIILAVVFFLYQYFQVFHSVKIIEASYPINAIHYLKAEKIESNIFSPYNWGGVFD